MTISMIAAMAENRVIGLDGRMPWHIPGELKRFRDHTLGRALIVGRKTHEAIGRVLPGRTSIIVTRQAGYQVEGAHVVHSVEEALALAKTLCDDIVIGGGGELYRQALKWVDFIYLSVIHAHFEGDTHFPALPDGLFREISREEVATSIPYSFVVYERVRA
ncbi:MAG: dihydrofolate reductase [Burkholderiaceae bacterium]|jgi:dihydrofolate reductase|nr:dihydrofolate reductase [Burkholderiaceae bacterium]